MYFAHRQGHHLRVRKLEITVYKVLYMDMFSYKNASIQFRRLLLIQNMKIHINNKNTIKGIVLEKLSWQF